MYISKLRMSHYVSVVDTFMSSDCLRKTWVGDLRSEIEIHNTLDTIRIQSKTMRDPIYIYIYIQR